MGSVALAIGLYVLEAGDVIESWWLLGPLAAVAVALGLYAILSPLLARRARSATARPYQFPDEQERQRMRDRLYLRSLDPLEVGLRVSQAPNGAYFFAYAPGLVPGYHTIVTVSSQPDQDDVEVHKAADGTMNFLGYVPPAVGTMLPKWSSEVTLEIFTEPWGENTQLIPVPLDRVTSIDQRSFQYGSLVEVSFRALSSASDAKSEQPSALDIDVTVPSPLGLQLAEDRLVTKLNLRVTNRGKTGTFVARAISDVGNVMPSDYRPGNLAWEGRREETTPIYGDGGSHDLVVAQVDRSRRKIRFVGPESSYTQPGQQQIGMEVDPVREDVPFDLEIREIETDRFIRRCVVIRLDEKGFPTLSVRG